MSQLEVQKNLSLFSCKMIIFFFFALMVIVFFECFYSDVDASLFFLVFIRVCVVESVL